MTIETCSEADGRWIAEVVDVPGAMAYGETREEAIAKAKELAESIRHEALRPARVPS